ncbi:MAG: hypothetical protein Q8O53_01280, partial [Candidatus Moranbacteria bacterium]|nr:hypothetical protein [Candidatus Moranbacteria bacterium]
VTGATFDEYSESILNGFSGAEVSLKVQFIPEFLGNVANRQWTVDGASVDETNGGIKFSAAKGVDDVYNIALTASVVQSQEIRQALRDIWGISPLASPEVRLSTSVQLELWEQGFAQGTLQGSKKYLAAIASYIPTSVMFSFRILLSVVLMLFTASMLFTLLPEQVGVSSARRR